MLHPMHGMHTAPRTQDFQETVSNRWVGVHAQMFQPKNDKKQKTLGLCRKEESLKNDR